jgi:hypothetical protein
MNSNNATECDTCGGSGRWESTLEDAPTVLVDLGPCPECLRSDDCECAPPINAHRHTAPRRDSPEVLRAHLAALAYEERDELEPITNCDGCGRAFFTWEHDDDTPLEHTDDGVLCRTCAGEPFTNGTEVPRWVAWSRFSALYTPVICAVYGDPEWVWAWCVSIPEAGREWCTDH